MAETSKKELAERYQQFCFGKKPGIGRFLCPEMHDEVFQQISGLNTTPISKVQLNQLLVISKCGSVSDGFFQYYWKRKPIHTYDVSKIPFYEEAWVRNEREEVISHDHLCWGLYRIFVDGLLYFGNVLAGFNSLRSLSYSELEGFFNEKRFDTEAIAARGPALDLKNISKDDRYLISEMACKTFGEVPADTEEAKKTLLDALRQHKTKGGQTIKFKDLLKELSIRGSSQDQLMLSFDEVLEEDLDNVDDLTKKFDRIFAVFVDARRKAAANTELYLSMVNDLDVYVATSMRNRKDFRGMAVACETIFKDPRLAQLHLRHFDPTMSAAKGHEDKGLIECLMVKCAKVLVYCEGEKESYGKDAEAAMALSLGKPVIFYCDQDKKTNFYRDVHPLSRLIDFRSGVAVGAIVTAKVEQVSELLKRIFENKMEYRIEHHEQRPGYLKLIETLTDSVVRLQTDDELLSATFWNNYHNRQRDRFMSLAAGKEAERLQE